MTSSNTSPVVSVVIPTRNRLALLQESVASVVEQRGITWEVVVVDDASEDGTTDWLRRLGDERIRSIHLVEHAERSAARNAGAAAARGRCLLFLDDDDRLRPGALAALARPLERDSTVAASVGGAIFFDKDGITRSFWRVWRTVRVEKPWRHVVFGWMAVPGQVMMRTDFFGRAGCWDGTWIPAEDIDLMLRLGGLGPFVLIPRMVLDYRVHPGQIPRPASIAASNDAMCSRFVERLPDQDAPTGRRALAARRQVDAAYQAFLEERTAGAVRLYGQVILTCPSIVMSPLLRWPVAEPALKSLLGPALLRLGRRARLAIGPTHPGQDRPSVFRRHWRGRVRSKPGC